MRTISEFLHDIRVENTHCKVKFPTNKWTSTALFEECGEVARALMDYDNGLCTKEHVWEECVQVANMALRIAQEGDPFFSYNSEEEPLDEHIKG